MQHGFSGFFGLLFFGKKIVKDADDSLLFFFCRKWYFNF